MKKILLLAVAAAFVLASCCGEQKTATMIPTPTPERPAGQEDMLKFAAEPIPVVRVAFIGLGMRGPGAVRNMTNIPGVEVVALCDMVQANVEKCNRMLEQRGFPKAKEFYGSEDVWRKVTALPEVDLVYTGRQHDGGDMGAYRDLGAHAQALFPA